jgi:hypothetical protein
MGTQVVLHRLWRVAFTRVSVHGLPIAVRVGVLSVNAKLLLKDSLLHRTKGLRFGQLPKST